MRLIIIAIALCAIAVCELKTLKINEVLNSLKITEAQLQIEKLNFELSIYREQDLEFKGSPN